MSLPTVRLGEICTVIMGQAPAGAAYNTTGNGWPLIAGAGDFIGHTPVTKKFTTQASKLSQTGDIVLGIRASIGAKVWSDSVYCLGRGVAGLRPGPNLDPSYLWHWLTHSASALAAKGKGATFKQVNRQDICEMPIELPTLKEQGRIAAILDQADALRAKRREALAHLYELTQSIFLDMFGDIPESQVQKVADVAAVQGGLQVSATRRSRPIEVPYLRVANVHRNRLSLSEVKTLKVTSTELARTRLSRGDLLIVCRRPRETARSRPCSCPLADMRIAR